MISTLDIVFGIIGVIILLAGWWLFGKWRIARENAEYDKRALVEKVYAQRASKLRATEFDWNDK